MKKILKRKQILEELEKIPEDKFTEIYNIIRYYRLGLKEKIYTTTEIMQFAGSWNDMPEDDFNEFLDELKNRRKNAFSSRKNFETSTD